MLAVCEKHARKQHSGLQSRMEFRGFRANVNPLAIYIYNNIYIYCILRYWDIDILIIWVKVLPSTYPKMSFNTANKPWFWPFSKRCCLSGCHFYNEVSMLCCSHLSIGWLQHPEWLRVHFVLKKYRGSSPICLIKSPFGGEYCGVCVCVCANVAFISFLSACCWWMWYLRTGISFLKIHDIRHCLRFCSAHITFRTAPLRSRTRSLSPDAIEVATWIHYGRSWDWRIVL